MYGGSLTTLIILIVCMYPSTMAEFAEIPISVSVELGMATPPCRCRHMSSHAFITWRVNSLPVGQFPNIRSGFVNESGNIVHTLTIPSQPQYNGTVVECVAIFFDGNPNEITPAVSIFFTPTNNSLPDNFDLVPSPLTVAVEQRTATFRCQYSLNAVISWRVNGMLLSAANLSNIAATIISGSNGVNTHIHVLTIGTLLVYNLTTIECVATFIDGSLPRVTAPVHLLIQDTPKRVENTTCKRDYSKDKLTTLWNHLPSLDINDTDPDLLYTVELYQITCGRNVLINQSVVAGNNVTEEGLDLMQIYKAAIAARNNVREARNGPSVEMKEEFMPLNGSTLVKLAKNSRINIQSDVPVPSYYEMILESLDNLKDNFITNITVERNGEMISMHTEVPQNSLWSVSILAYGCKSDTIVTNYELSTHGIQNVVARPSLPGQISVTGDNIDRSTATGMFVVVYSLTNPDDVHYVASRTSGGRIRLDVTGLTGTEYGVSTFALENGLPFPGVVTSPKNVAISNSDQDMAPQQPPLVEYDLTRMTSGVCITCTFLDSSTMGCVAVVHQRISRLNSAGLVNIEASHRFNRSGDTAYGCIEGVDLEQYQVGVVGGKMILEPNNEDREVFNAGGIAGGVAFAVILAVVVLLLILGVALLKKRRKLTELEPFYSEVTRHSSLPSHTVVNIASVHAAVNNHDVESAKLSEGPNEDQPLLFQPLPSRVMADGESTPPLPPRLVEDGGHVATPVADHGLSTPPVTESADQQTITSPHQVTSDSGGGDPTYAPVLTIKSSITLPPPTATEKVSYEDIRRYQNEQGQQYALTQAVCTSKGGAVDDLHQVVYVKIKPHSISEDLNIDCTSDHADTPPEPVAAVREPLTTERLFSFLLPHASKWRKLGIALSLDEDRLDDEIYTNNETDEACLQEVIELYMLRSDLDHSWEKIQAALEDTESSSDVPTSVQEENPSQDSPRITGKTIMHVPSTAAAAAVNIHHDEEMAIDIEEPIDLIHGVDSISDQFSSDKQPAAHKENGEEQGGSSDSGYSGSQQSESESSDNSAMIESGENPTKLSQASSEEHSEVSGKNISFSICLAENLEDYESGDVHSVGSEASFTGDGSNDGEFGRPTEETIPSSPTATTPCSSADQSALKVEGFCEKPDDRTNDEELCKIQNVTSVQDSGAHKNYKDAMMHQLGLRAGQITRDKLEYNNAVGELSLVRSGIEHSNQRVQHSSIQTQFNQPVKFYAPTSSAALDITKIHVHDLVSTSSSVSSKYSPSLICVTVHLENNCFLFSFLMLHVVVMYLSAIVNVCSMNVCVYLMYHIY